MLLPLDILQSMLGLVFMAVVAFVGEITLRPS
jgi:hypothetical protein